jgi:F-type H+-transporting ATPase subunit alpha
MPVPRQVIVLFTGGNGYVDDVPVEKVRQFEKELLRFLSSSHPGIEETITKEKALSAETEKALRSAIEEFKKSSPLVQKEEQKAPPKAEEKAAGGGKLQAARRATERETAKKQ